MGIKSKFGSKNMLHMNNAIVLLFYNINITITLISILCITSLFLLLHIIIKLMKPNKTIEIL